MDVSYIIWTMYPIKKNTLKNMTGSVSRQSNFILSHYNTKKTKNEYWGLKKGGLCPFMKK